MNWSDVKYQQADSLAGALLFLVCKKVNIKLKHLIKVGKNLDKPLFQKMSGIKKSKAYFLLKEMTKSNEENQGKEFLFDTNNKVIVHGDISLKCALKQN